MTKKFLWVNAIALSLVVSWFIPLTAALWADLDLWAFHALNDSLKNSPLTAIFWALANVKLSDLFGAVFIVSFSLIYVFSDGKEVAKFRLAQFFYYLIWFELGILSLKQVIFPIFLSLDFLRDSPTLLFEGTFRLSEVAPWLKIKDSSRWCYPSDHAFIVLEWVGFITVYAGMRLGLLAFVTSLLFILPRLVAGAHWLSDILVGSVPIALVFLSVACFTPIYPFFMRNILRQKVYINEV